MDLAVLAVSAVLASVDASMDVEANLALVSDYRSRGLSSSDETPAVQGGLTLAGFGGAYVGAWASSLEPSGDARSEVNLFAGWARPAFGLDWDMSVTAFAFPDQPDTLYGELTAAASRKIGPAMATVGWSYAPEQDNLERANNYWFAEKEAPLGLWDLNILGAVGLESGPLGDLAEDGGDKWDWSLGLGGDLGAMGWSLAYMDSTEDTELSDAHLVFSVGRDF